jgi:hypothetical protein
MGNSEAEDCCAQIVGASYADRQVATGGLLTLLKPYGKPVAFRTRAPLEIATIFHPSNAIRKPLVLGIPPFCCWPHSGAPGMSGIVRP